MNKKHLILKTTVSLLLLTSIASCKITPTDIKKDEPNFATKPKKVSSISVPKVMTTDDGIPLSWSYVDDATGYYVYYQTANEYLNNATPSSIAMNSDEINYTFNDLKPAERYVFAVQAYKVVGSEIIKGDMSSYVESATKPNLEVKSEVNNQKAKLYFSTSERSSVLKTGTDIYEPEFIIESDMDLTIPADTQSSVLKSTKTTLSPIAAIKEEMWETPLKSNAEVLFSVNMRIEEEDLLSTKTDITLKADPSLVPNKIKSADTTNGLKNRIAINFEASPMNDGVDGKQVFKIERTAVKTNTVTVILDNMDEKNQPLLKENKENKLLYTFVDNTASTNTEYKYTITPYYAVQKGKNTSYYTSDESSITIEKAYTLPYVEGFTGALSVLNDAAQDEKNKYKLVDDVNKKTTYKPTLTFTLPSFVNNTGLTYSLFRSNVANRNTVNIEPNDGENTDSNNVYIFEDQRLPEVKEGEKFTFTDTVEISGDDDKNENGYQYTIIIKNADKEFGNAITSNIVYTKPSIEQIDFVKSFSASDVKYNAGAITLNFEIMTDAELQKINTTLSLNNITFTLYRGNIAADKEVIKTYSYDEIKALNGKFVDDNDGKKLNNGSSYYYQLRALYKDENSAYNNIYQIKNIENAKTLNAVKSLTATKGTSTKGITLTFEKVDEATDYAVYYKEEGATNRIKATSDIISIDKENSTALFTKDVNTANAGRKYVFFINALDANKNETTETTVSDTGYLYGPYGFKANATNYTTSDIYSDKIVLNWTEIPNTNKYEIDVYTDKYKSNILNTYSTKSNNFTFKLSDVENDVGLDFPLSRPYYFVVRPLLSKDETISEEFLSVVEGSWILPPKNIVASKAESWNTVNVSWDNIGESARSYKVYRRVKGSTSWSGTPVGNVQNDLDSQRIEYSDFNVDENVDYEYTVTSVIANRLIESEKQSRFVLANNKLYDNVGYLLSPPETALVTENSNEEYTVEIKPFKNIQNFVIDMTDGNYGGKYIIKAEGDTFKTETTGVLNTDVKVSKNEYGIISVTFKRSPMLLVDSFSHKVSVQTLTEKENSDETSASYEIIHTPKKISNKEIVNLTNPILYELLTKANAEFDGDWWGNQKTSKGDGYNITSEGWTGLGWGADNSFITLTNYKNAATRIILSTNSSIKLLTRDEGAAGYLGTDPLDSIGKNKVGELKVTLPGAYGEATIVYDTVKVNGTGGSYTVTYNGTTETFDYTQVHESKRALL